MIKNPPTRKDPRLRDYQKRGVDFVRRSRTGSILFWDMRTGKTRTALIAPKQFRRMVIVAPKVTEGVWSDECAEVYDGQRPVVVNGRSRYDLPNDAPILWMNYEIVEAHWSWFLENKIDLLILDEAQYIKNKRAKRTQAVHALCGCSQKVIALTGTPIYNRPADLWGILWAVQPGQWPHFYDFSRRYCDGKPTGFGGFDSTGFSRHRKRELQGKLEGVVDRVRWKDIVDVVPELDRIRVPVVIGKREQARCRKLARDLRTALDGYEGSASPNIAAKLRRATMLRTTIGRGKVRPTVDFLQTIPDNEKVVVWTHHHEVADAIADKLLGAGHQVARVHGRMTSKKRRKQMSYFNGDARFMIVSLEAGGVGIDLSAARIAVFAELSWTPSVLAQAERRVYKGTENRACAMYYLIAKGTIEDRIMDLLEEKVRLVYDAMDDDDLLSMIDDITPPQDDMIESLLALV